MNKSYEDFIKSSNNYWEYSTYSKIDPEVKENFPFKQAREEQLETISEIKEAIDKGYKYIVLEAGTGTGKSVIAATLARIYDSAYIITKTKQLQKQYYDDFKYLNYKLVKGRGNFYCKEYAEKGEKEICEYGRCILENYKCPYHIDEISFHTHSIDDSCPYLYQKIAASQSPVVISNYHFAYYFPIEFPCRKLLIFDEAHNAEALVMSLLSHKFDKEQIKKDYDLVISQEQIDAILEGSYEIWISFIKSIGEAYKKHLQKLNKIPKSRQTLLVLKTKAKLIKEIDELETLISRIRRNPYNWIVDYNSEKKVISFEPIEVSGYAKEALMKKGEICVFMSGTILDYKLFASYLGIGEDEIYAIRRTSPFDFRRNPVITSRNMEMRYSDLKEMAPRTIPEIDKILTKHKNEKGVIHTISYECKKYLKRKLKSGRFVDHKTYDREAKLNKFIKSSDSLVLISPSMDEGVDLPGELCRFQVIYKVPYPSLGSRQTKIRSDRDPRWFNYQTTLRLLQTYGRGLRFQNDYCKTYFIDSRLQYFVNIDEMYYQFIPNYFKAAIEYPPLSEDELNILHPDVKKELKEEIYEIYNPKEDFIEELEKYSVNPYGKSQKTIEDFNVSSTAKSKHEIHYPDKTETHDMKKPEKADASKNQYVKETSSGDAADALTYEETLKNKAFMEYYEISKREYHEDALLKTAEKCQISLELILKWDNEEDWREKRKKEKEKRLGRGG